MLKEGINHLLSVQLNFYINEKKKDKKSCLELLHSLWSVNQINEDAWDQDYVKRGFQKVVAKQYDLSWWRARVHSCYHLIGGC